MVLMIAFVSDLVERQRKFLTDRAKERVVLQSDLLAASAVPQITTEDYSGLNEVLETLVQDKAVRYALVTDAAGKVIGHSDISKVNHWLVDPESIRILHSKVKTTQFIESEQSVKAASPILNQGETLGWAWVAGDFRDDAKAIAVVRRTGIYYVLIAVASGLVFSIVLSNTITKQLRLLLAGTERLSRNELGEPVRITTDTEVGTVARAFNDAMRKLHEQQLEVDRARHELEAEVSERRRAEEELQNANRAMETANESLQRFAYAASHDLQEPLRAVANYSELLTRRYRNKLDEDANDFIGYIHDGAVRMQSMVKALLDYSRAGARDGSKPAAIDTAEALDDALKNLQTAVEDSGAKVETHKLLPVHAHRVAVTQIFQNLIGNAIKYTTDRRPVVKISSVADGGFLKFAVQDNGPGIAERDYERIFTIFKRAHGADIPGAGVGLSICAKIVQGYGGKIWVESQKGEGSTFWFTLPRARSSITQELDPVTRERSSS